MNGAVLIVIMIIIFVVIAVLALSKTYWFDTLKDVGVTCDAIGMMCPYEDPADECPILNRLLNETPAFGESPEDCPILADMLDGGKNMDYAEIRAEISRKWTVQKMPDDTEKAGKKNGAQKKTK